MKKFCFINQNNKKKIRNNKGFTLVELIVVLVILAVLAAILVPALLGWIDRAKQSSLLVECRACVIAAQSVGTENYALGKEGSEEPYDDVKRLAEVDGDITEIEYDEKTKATVKHLTYEKGGQSVTYCADYEKCNNHSESYTFDDAESSPKKLANISEPTKKQYEPALNAVLNTLYNSLVKEVLENQGKHISYVLFNNGKVTKVCYYSALNDMGHTVLYNRDDRVNALNDEISKALEPTEYMLQGNNTTRIFYDWDGNVVANDKGPAIAGQGAPSDIRFKDGTSNGVHIKLSSDTNTWS